MPITGDYEGDSAEFVQLLTENQRNLHRFIHSLLLNKEDVEEVLQETNLVLWRVSDQFEIGTNFRAWASTVALNQVRAFIKKRKRNSVLFDEDTITALARRQRERSRNLDRRADALSDCVSKLSVRKREFLNQRYAVGLSVDEIARQFGLSSAAVYKFLSRIRSALHSCVDRAVPNESEKEI